MVTDRPDLRIIQPEEFQAARETLHGRREAFRINGERQSNKFLFSTLIKCKECGWSFRRTVRTYKNTYVRWVCSGHNGKGAQSCPNGITLEEEELMGELEQYFYRLLKDRKGVTDRVVKEFTKVYRGREDNEGEAKKLRESLARIQRTRQKYMEMYTDDLISRGELNQKLGSMKKEVERLENELKLAEHNLSKGDQLQELLRRTFRNMEDIVSVRTMTNEQLKQIIGKIQVDREGNVDIYLRLPGELGLEEDMLIESGPGKSGVPF